MSRFTRINAWLQDIRGGIGLEDPASQELEGPVLPILDIFQGGWASRESTHDDGTSWAVGASAAAASVLVLPIDRNVNRLIWAFELTATTGAAHRLEIGYTVSTSPNIVHVGRAWTQQVSAGDIRLALCDWILGPPPLIVPAGFGFAFRHGGTAAGESIGGEILYTSHPAGFNPLGT